MDMLSKTVAEQGETWAMFFEPKSLAGLLHSLGFRDIAAFYPELLDTLYQSGHMDGLRKSGAFSPIFAKV